MYKFITILYISCFALYILFSRKPDYFDAEFTPGVIVAVQPLIKKVQYQSDGKTYVVPVTGWGASKVSPGERVEVIFDPSNPSNGSLYSFFVYWLQLPELLYSVLGYIILFIAAVIITGNNASATDEPDEEKVRKRKYDD